MEPGIHDEAEVEKVKRALLKADYSSEGLLTDSEAGILARAALSAIDVAGTRAKTIEECAKIAEQMPNNVLCFSGSPENGWATITGQSVTARAIRALSMGKENGE